MTAIPTRVRQLVNGVWQYVTAEENGGGGSQPGAAIVRGPFNFAFDTPGLADGVAVYTPAVDDMILNAWIEVTTAFNGTTPFADLGTFSGGFFATAGLFASVGGTAIDLSSADDRVIDNDWSGQALGPATGSGMWQFIWFQKYRWVPARVVAADPIRLVVSQDGSKGGTAIGGSAGAGRVYLMTATPDAFS